MIILVQSLLLPSSIQASPASRPQQQPTGPVLDPGLTWSGAIGGLSTSASSALESGSLLVTYPTRQDYSNAYTEAWNLLQVGRNFRSRELQRLDPATSVAEPGNENKCAFSVTGIQNNYVNFNEGRLYWRFCGDYDETYVGSGAVP